MDLNTLFYRQQVALMRAERAACALTGKGYQSLADLYGAVINGRRAAWQDLGREASSCPALPL